jgi:hypothetical protein
MKMSKTGLKTYSVGNQKWCSYAVNGRMEIPKLCIRNFECWHCAFNYWLEEVGERPSCEACPQAGFLMLKAA